MQPPSGGAWRVYVAALSAAVLVRAQSSCTTHPDACGADQDCTDPDPNNPSSVDDFVCHCPEAQGLFGRQQRAAALCVDVTAPPVAKYALDECDVASCLPRGAFVQGGTAWSGGTAWYQGPAETFKQCAEDCNKFPNCTHFQWQAPIIPAPRFGVTHPWVNNCVLDGSCCRFKHVEAGVTATLYTSRNWDTGKKEVNTSLCPFNAGVNRCVAAGQQCHDPDHSEVGTWFCVCTGATYGHAVMAPAAPGECAARAAPFNIDECNDPCGATSSNVGAYVGTADRDGTVTDIGGLADPAECKLECIRRNDCLAWSFHASWSEAFREDPAYGVLNTVVEGGTICILFSSYKPAPTPSVTGWVGGVLNQLSCPADTLLCSSVSQVCDDPSAGTELYDDWSCVCPMSLWRQLVGVVPSCDTPAPPTPAPPTPHPPTPAPPTSHPPTPAPPTSQPPTPAPSTRRPRGTSVPGRALGTGVPPPKTPPTPVPATNTPMLATAAPVVPGVPDATGVPQVPSPRPVAVPSPSPASSTETRTGALEMTGPAAGARPTVVEEILRQQRNVDRVQVISAGSAIAAVVGAGGAVQAVRLAALAPYCLPHGQRPDEGYHFAMSPLQLKVRGSYALGAVVGNALLAAGAAVLGFCVAQAMKHVGPRVAPQLFEGMDAEGLVKFPSCALVVFFFVFQGTTLAAMDLVYEGRDMTERTAGWGACCVALVVTCCTFFRIKRDVPRFAFFKVDPVPLYPIVQFFLGPGEWVSRYRTTEWVERWATAVRPYTQRAAWYICVELVASFAVSAAHSAHPATLFGCGHVKLFTGMIILILLACECRVWPHPMWRNNVIDIVVLCLEAVAMGLSAAAYYLAWDAGLGHAVTMLTVALCFVMLRTLCDVAAMLLLFLNDRRKRLQEAVWNDTAPPADGAPLKDGEKAPLADATVALLDPDDPTCRDAAPTKSRRRHDTHCDSQATVGVTVPTATERASVVATPVAVPTSMATPLTFAADAHTDHDLSASAAALPRSAALQFTRCDTPKGTPSTASLDADASAPQFEPAPAVAAEAKQSRPRGQTLAFGGRSPSTALLGATPRPDQPSVRSLLQPGRRQISTTMTLRSPSTIRLVSPAAPPLNLGAPARHSPPPLDLLAGKAPPRPRPPSVYNTAL